MEGQSSLDPINEQQLFVLHYIFLPRISRSLRHFQDAWNNHGVRTERGNTPNQLFTAGSLHLQRSGLSALDFFQNVPENYGIEQQGLIPDEDTFIPQINVELTQAHQTQLESVNPLTDDYGIWENPPSGAKINYQI